MKQTVRVFISGTSTDLASYRDAVKSELLTKGVLPVEQTNFPPDYRAVEAMLEERIGECDAVICLVGWMYGAEPSGRPEGLPQRSYTQIEYDIARRLGKPVYQFLAVEDCPPDRQVEESAAARELQREHREAIERGDLLWELFGTQAQLRQRVAQIRFEMPGPGQARPQNLPYVSLGKLFKGRDDFLSKLRARLLSQSRENNASSAMRISQPTALCGLGGVGKTRLAVEYGWRYLNEYNAELFVVADSADALQRNIAQLTGPLVLNLPEWDRQEEEVKFAAAIRWLLEHPGWFLILDNVDNKSAVQAVEKLLTRIPAGHVLITSRWDDWNRDVEPLDLDVLSAEDAAGFLLERTQSRRRATANDTADAATLSRELDGLALGLEQAGAYIERQRCTIGEYLKRWRGGEERIRTWFDEVKMHYPRSVALTYDTTMQEVGPAAAALFRVLSWFAPDPVPEAAVTSEHTGRILSEVTRWPDGVKAEVYPEEALADLISFCMLKKLDVQGVPCVLQHRLVREVAQTQTPKAERPAVLKGAVGVFADFAPKDAYRFEAWKEWRMLISHAESLWQSAQTLTAHGEWDLPLMEGLALYYLGQGKYAEAIPIQRELLKEMKARLGDNCGQVCLATNDLALMLDSSGNSAEAQPLYREALEGWKRLEENPYEFGLEETMHNLAASLAGTEDMEEAERLARESLALFEKKAGPYHWRTLMAEFTLGKTLWAKDKKEEAIEILKENIKKKSAHLQQGANHPDTLDSVYTLAGIQLAEARLDEAEPLARRVLAGRELVLGSDDPATLEAVLLLEVICAKLNKKTEAESLCDRLMDAAVSSGDPERLLSARKAAFTLYETGEYDRAEKILRSLIEKRFEVAGTYCHLARLLIIGDKPQKALEAVERAWEVRSGAPWYVVARILWLRLALLNVSLDGSPTEARARGEVVGYLKTVMDKEGPRMEWKMGPVLEALRRTLPGEEVDFLGALVRAMSGEMEVSGLDGYPDWREFPALGFEAQAGGE